MSPIKGVRINHRGNDILDMPHARTEALLSAWIAFVVEIILLVRITRRTSSPATICLTTIPPDDPSDFTTGALYKMDAH